MANDGKPAPRLPADPTSAGPLPSGVGAPARIATALLLIGFLALTACVVLLGSLAEGIRDQEVYTLDRLATPFLHGLASPVLDAVMNAATTAGSNLVIPPLFVVAIALLLRIRRPGAALFLTIASGGALLLNGLMKVYFQRPRPQLPWANTLPDFSFPSGHTMNSVAFYCALAVIIWSVRGRRTGRVALAVAVVLSVLVGLSRIYLGYHYFTDVLGAFLAGTSWLLIVLAAFRSGPLARYWEAPERTAARTAARTPPRGRTSGKAERRS